MECAGAHEAALPTQRSEARPASRRNAPADRVLALQRIAGNRAVGALLARDPKVKPKPKPEEKEAPARSKSYAVLPPVGTIELESVQWSTQRGPPTGNRENESRITEIVVSSRVGDHSPKLHEEVLKGKPMDVEVVIASGAGRALRLRLKNAIIASYSHSGGGDHPSETWTLNAESITFEYEGAGSGY